MRIFEQILLQTRQKFAGILYVWQEFLTQYAAKFAEKTRVYAREDRFSGLVSTHPNILGVKLPLKKILRNQEQHRTTLSRLSPLHKFLK